MVTLVRFFDLKIFLHSPPSPNAVGSTEGDVRCMFLMHCAAEVTFTLALCIGKSCDGESNSAVYHLRTGPLEVDCFGKTLIDNNKALTELPPVPILCMLYQCLMFLTDLDQLHSSQKTSVVHKNQNSYSV